jgi:hypothetical protein
MRDQKTKISEVINGFMKLRYSVGCPDTNLHSSLPDQFEECLTFAKKVRKILLNGLVNSFSAYTSTTDQFLSYVQEELEVVVKKPTTEVPVATAVQESIDNVIIGILTREVEFCKYQMALYKYILNRILTNSLV